MTRDAVVRCVLDGDRPRVVDGPGSRVCAHHRARLEELLDPEQTGQTYTAPGERRVPPSIPVLYRMLNAMPGQTGEKLGGSVFRSTPPCRLDVLAHRDLRSRADEVGRDDDRYPQWSILRTLLNIAITLGLRDVHGRPMPIPRSVEGCSTWLYNRIDRLTEAVWIDDAWHDLNIISRQLRSTTGDPAPRRVGECYQLVNEDGRHNPDGEYRCATSMYLPTQPLKGGDEAIKLPPVQCPSCRWVYQPEELWRLSLKRGQQAAS